MKGPYEKIGVLKNFYNNKRKSWKYFEPFRAQIGTPFPETAFSISDQPPKQPEKGSKSKIKA